MTVATYRVWLSMGSNMGDREDHLISGLRGLRARGLTLEAWSGIYETEPVGFLDQPLFLNMTLRMRTALDPWRTLELCQAVEKDRQRERGRVWGPRTLDIDLLLYENWVLRDDRLTLPHPRIRERAFVLVPLKAMDPEIYKQLDCGMGSGEVRLHISAEDVKITLGSLDSRAMD
jgi:2-amino-4-hydroxy-6-hydroxymethyldihydropteridine diphosphokinase